MHTMAAKHKRVRFSGEKVVSRSALTLCTRESCPVELSLSVSGITSSFREAGRCGNWRRRRQWSVIRIIAYNDTAALNAETFGAGS